jgi:hypothetical protein
VLVFLGPVKVVGGTEVVAAVDGFVVRNGECDIVGGTVRVLPTVSSEVLGVSAFVAADEEVINEPLAVDHDQAALLLLIFGKGYYHNEIWDIWKKSTTSRRRYLLVWLDRVRNKCQSR